MSQPNPYNPGENDGLMQKRTLIAFLLMGLVLFSMQYFMKPDPATQAVKNAKPAVAAKPGPTRVQAAAVTAPAASSGAPQPAAGLFAAHDETKTIVDTDLFHIVFSNRGA